MKLIIFNWLLLITLIDIFTIENYISTQFDRYSSQEGLSNLVVYDILQDETGYIWLGTGNGISRFDGYEFKNYINIKNDPDSIGPGPAADLFIDHKGRLWIAVFSSGLYLYNSDRDNFKHYKHIPDDINSISSNVPVSIGEDSKGFIWVSTVDNGLNRLNPQTGEFIRFFNDPNNQESLLSNKLSGIVVDNEDIIWISTFDGEIITYDINENNFNYKINLKKESPHLTIGSEGDIWFPTAGNGLFQYKRGTGEFIQYKNRIGDEKSLSLDVTIKVIEDNDGDIWVSTWGAGICRLNRVNNEFQRYKHNGTDSRSLSSNETWGIFEDKTGVIWVGTYGAGLNRYDKKDERFKIYCNRMDSSNSLSNNNVKTILEDSSGNLWIGTLGGGLNRYNRELEENVIFRKKTKSENNIDTDFIYGIIEDQNNRIWVASDSSLLMYNRDENRFTKYLEGKHIRSIFQDSLGNLWIGTHYKGVYRYNSKGEFIHYDINDQFLSVFYEDKNKTLWLGGATSLYQYKSTEDKFIKHFSEFKLKKLEGLLITDITEDNSGNLWVATSTQLVQYNLKLGNYRIFTKKDGLMDDSIASLEVDSDGNIWIGSSLGVSKYDITSETIHNYDIGAVNRNSGYSSDDGKIYFGGFNGLISFYPQNIKDNEMKPNVVITSFKIFNKEQFIDLNNTNDNLIKIDYRDNFFSFEFAALDYSNPDKNQYKYKLEGFDENWISVSEKRRYASYTNLDGGRYKFNVIASNNDGVWNEIPTEVELYIIPLFRDTILFKILLLLILIAFTILVLFYIKKLKESLKKQKSSEKELLNLKIYLNEILDAMPSTIIGIDEERKIRLWNRTAKQYTNIKPEKVINNYFKDINHDITKHISEEEICQCLENNKLIVKSDIKINVENYIDITLFPLNTKDIKHMILQIVNVTKKHMLSEKLQQSSKMDALGQLAGGLAHDFNNILSGIINATYLLNEDNTAINIKGKKYVDLIRKASLNAGDLASKLLTFSRKSDHKISDVNIHTILGEALEILERTLDKNVNLVVEKNSKKPILLGNHSDLQNIIINLCINSSHAMPNGGDIRIFTKDVELNTTFCDNSEFDINPGSYCEIIISDSGEGIASDKLKKIFEPFYTTKEKGKGTGLGLSIVYGTIKGLNGAIKVNSEVGFGTTFYIYLPISYNSKVIEETKEIVGGLGTILLIEDEEIVRETSKELLKILGYEVLTAKDGYEGLDIYKKFIDKVDIVLLDMIMPNLGGKETFLKLKEINPICKIIIASGYAKDVDIQDLKSEDISGFIQKPYKIEDLSAVIDDILKNN